MTKEDFKQYVITEDGKVYSKRSKRFLTQRENEFGYKTVAIDGKTYRVHRLVALMYIENPLDKPEVNHIDGDKSNNHKDNLEWVTSKENKKHAWDMKLYTDIRENHHNAKLTDDKVHEICRMLEEGYRNIDIADKFNMHPHWVGKIKDGSIWRTISENYNIQVKRNKTKSTNTVMKVCSYLEEGVSEKEISKLTGMKVSEVHRIRRGEIFTCISDKFNFFRGSKRISEEDVIKICGYLKEGLTVTQIVNKTGFTRYVISKIKLRKSWKSITKDYEW